jgi:dihydropteroate synthase
LRGSREPLVLGAASIALDRPQIVGILNVTPDSFSDGGRYADLAALRAQAERMLADGAALIDVGGESTRPGAAAVDVEEELRRVIPAVTMLVELGTAVSVDTRRAAVMAAALAAGAQVINDVSALRYDPASLAIVAQSDAAVVLMHAGGADDLHARTGTGDIVQDVYEFLRERRDVGIAGGIAATRIILDPGIGFGKSLADNLALMNALPMFHALGCPLLVGASRKRMIAALSAGESADRRLGGSLALALKAMDAGVQLHRVHDVAETVQAARVWAALR